MKYSVLKIKVIFSLLLVFSSIDSLYSQVNQVKLEKTKKGIILKVDSTHFVINGMNWDMVPIGKNVIDSNFWGKTDSLIKIGLDREMSLLKEMNVNVIRHYIDIPPKWIQYIYENYGIFTLLNHSFGRYGLTVDGVWIAKTDYTDPKIQEALLSEIKQLTLAYKNTPGLLMYLLGNENNYGLFWAGSETEDFPEKEEEKQLAGEQQGRPMYKLMNTAAKMIHEADVNHPVAICNGDLLFIDIIAQECQDVDVFGVNSYRGVSFTDLYKTVREKLDKPVLMTEFGADAFNAINHAEDQKSQAYYLLGNWKEIYENLAGFGKNENSIGGMTFQFSDGWWKYDFDNRKNTKIHDKISTWTNGGYSIDLVSGKHNMNEEWFGICAKGPTDDNGLYELYPRAAYYVLKEIHQLNPTQQKVTGKFLTNFFNNINLQEAVSKGKFNEDVLRRINHNKND